MFLVFPLHIGYLFTKTCHLLLLQYTFVFYGNDLYEVIHVVVPVIEHPAGQCRPSVEVVLSDEFEQFLPAYTVFHESQFHHIHIAEIVESMVLVPYIRHSARHSGGEVAAGLTENHHRPLIKICPEVAP